MDSSAVEFSKIRVLMVENNRLMRRILREMLRGFGVAELEETDNVPDAVSLIYREPFDVVILDFFLGDMDGADFTWRLRRDPACRNRKVPILLITAEPHHEKVLKVRDAGVDGMLAKPISPVDLYTRLEALLVRPRPFIVSQDYVGPDRRAQTRLTDMRRNTAGEPAAAGAKRLSLFVEPDEEALLLTKTVSALRQKVSS